MRRELMGETLRALPLQFGNERYEEEVCPERMRCDLFSEAGYSICSGTIEPDCKHVVQQRFRQSGMRWSRLCAQAMLALRSTLLGQPHLNSIELLILLHQTSNLGCNLSNAPLLDSRTGVVNSFNEGAKLGRCTVRFNIVLNQ